MIRDVETVLCRDDAQPWYRLIHFWLAFTRIGKPLANQKTKQNSPEPAHCLLYNNEVLPTIKHHFQSYLENDQKVLDSHSLGHLCHICVRWNTDNMANPWLANRRIGSWKADQLLFRLPSQLWLLAYQRADLHRNAPRITIKF